ncbi:ABC transporter substrate-binding protein [Caminicella sporogenes]|uniref:ABC transporter substrate-binding protein n=1 Tax=Caminicella sporogenes TaxID=166485 RepID=UPI002540D7E6|nr:ABC transporter substrate-binding protein [Caminicella sporogenes]WIF95443.1 ABC transporter substrate-binding protein [Caminicella sporogenes]
MKNVKIKTIIQILLVLIITLFLGRTYIEKAFDNVSIFDNKKYAIDIVDDSGYRIKMEKPAKRIISLYSAHTENLFSLGLDKEIIGVGRADIYPVQALSRKVYDYRSDPEKVISAKPDLVLIRPFIERKSPNFVKTLKRAGITVVSLYPEKFEDFDDYIIKLGILTGKKNTAEKLLKKFHEELEAIREKTSKIENKVGVYFESSDRGYKTVTTDSMPAAAIEMAGGINVASDAKPIQEGSSIAAYGIERILEKAKEIDVYVSQRGVMGAGGNYHSISIRPGFKAINAVKNKRIFEINQKIISSPTFRYIKGVKELCRMFYPEIFDDLSVYNSDKEITREEIAEIYVKKTHKTIFVPTSSYYRKKHETHTYGFFKDVPPNHPRFDYIETAVLSGYIDGYKENGEEYFYPEKRVTRDEFAKTVYLIGDFKSKDKNINIKDIDEVENKRIVQILVDNGIFKLKDGKFNPKEYVTVNEVIDILNKVGTKGEKI